MIEYLEIFLKYFGSLLCICGAEEDEGANLA